MSRSAKKPANPAVVAAMAVGTIVALGVVATSTLSLLSLSAPAPAAASAPPAASVAVSRVDTSPASNTWETENRGGARAQDRVPDALLDGNANPFAPLPARVNPFAPLERPVNPSGVAVSRDSQRKAVRRRPVRRRSAPRAIPKLPPLAGPWTRPDPSDRPVAPRGDIAPAEVALPALLGTLQGDEDMALVRYGTHTSLVGIGESIGTWTVAQIRPGRLLLRQGKQSLVLREESKGSAESSAGD